MCIEPISFNFGIKFNVSDHDRDREWVKLYYAPKICSIVSSKLRFLCCQENIFTAVLRSIAPWGKIPNSSFRRLQIHGPLKIIRILVSFIRSGRSTSITRFHSLMASIMYTLSSLIHSWIVDGSPTEIMDLLMSKQTFPKAYNDYWINLLPYVFLSHITDKAISFVLSRPPSYVSMQVVRSPGQWL